jgi:hypothetical protein
MAHRDWLPAPRAEQLAMAQNWIGVLGRKGQAWGIRYENGKGDKGP